ncbi:MAG: histidine kinase [Flavobacteriales bacterium]|nr:histidine kinase [Flavobacteriales bacterium]
MERLFARFSTCCFSLLIAFTMCGQKKYMEKISSSRSQEVVGNARMTALLDSAERAGDDRRDTAFRMVETALLWSLDAGDRLTEARSYAVLAGLFAKEEQCDLAISYYDKCIETSLNEYSSVVMQAELDRCVCLRRMNRLLEARTELEALKGKTLSTFSEAPRTLIPEINNQIAGILLDIGDIARSDQVLKENAGYLSGTDKVFGSKNAEVKAETRLLQGLVSFKDEKRAEGLGYIGQAWSVADSVSGSKQRYKLKSDIADQLEANGEIALTERYRTELSGTYQWTINNDAERLSNQVELGQAQCKNNNTELAINTLSNALEDPKLSVNTTDPKFLDLRMLALKNLSETHIEAGNPQAAQKYLNDYVATLEVVSEEKKKKLEANLGLFSSLTADVQRMKILEKDREINQKQIALLRSQGDLQASQLFSRNALIGSLIVLVLLLAGLLLFRQRARNKERLASRLVELRSLRAQMNPHFIFNALNSVNHYVALQDERKANRYLTDLSGLMRKVLSYSELDLIDLDDELELLDQYMRLEHERFSDRFDLRFEVDPALKGAGLHVPPMLVQPFIENAIWHGLRHKDGKGLLSVVVKDTGSAISFEVTDDGIGRAKAAEMKRAHAKASKGIDNARNRIALVNSLYSARLTLQVEDLNPDGTGTRVRFVVPKDLERHG